MSRPYMSIYIYECVFEIWKTLDLLRGPMDGLFPEPNPEGSPWEGDVGRSRDRLGRGIAPNGSFRGVALLLFELTKEPRMLDYNTRLTSNFKCIFEGQRKKNTWKRKAAALSSVPGGKSRVSNSRTLARNSPQLRGG